MTRDTCFVHIPKTGGSSFWKMLARAGGKNHRIDNTYRVSLQEFGNVSEDLKALAIILDQAAQDPEPKPLLIHHHTLSCPGKLRDFRYVFSTRDPIKRCFSEYRHHCLIASREMETQPGNWFDVIGASQIPRHRSVLSYFSRFKPGLGIYRRTIYSLSTGVDHTHRRLPWLWTSLADRKLRRFLTENVATMLDLTEFTQADKLSQTAKTLGVGPLENTVVEVTRTRRGSMANKKINPLEWSVLLVLTLSDRLFLAYVRWCIRRSPTAASAAMAPERNPAEIKAFPARPPARTAPVRLISPPVLAEMAK